MKKSLFASLALAGSLLFVFGTSNAAITLAGTRLVYDAGKREASMLVKNQGAADVVIQSWLGGPNEEPVPFAITPALSRLGGAKQQLLRVFYQGQGLPTDRESVVWLSVQEIPQKLEENNSLQLALRQRIKVFYRPTGLPGSPEAAASGLQWRLNGSSLEVVNNAAYHVSLFEVQVEAGERKFKGAAEMVPPLSTKTLSVPQLTRGIASAQAKVRFGVVNDYGGSTYLEAPLSTQ